MKRFEPLVIIMLMMSSLAFTQKKSEVSEQIVGSIGNQNLNVLYAGFDNRISVAASGLTDEFEVVCDSCASIVKTDEPGIYIVRVLDITKNVTITIKDSNIKASKKHPLLKQKFRVLPMPRPITYFKHLGPYRVNVSKEDLSIGELVYKYFNCPLELNIQFLRFTITFTMEGHSQSFTYEGNSIPEYSEVLRYAVVGGTIMIEPEILLNNVKITPIPIAFKIVK